MLKPGDAIAPICYNKLGPRSVYRLNNPAVGPPVGKTIAPILMMNLNTKVKFALVAPAMLVLFLADLCLPGINVAIGYISFLVLASLLLHREALYRIAILLIVLTYLAYFLKPTPAVATTIGGVDYRLLNRSLVAIVILGLVPVLLRFPFFQPKLRDSDGRRLDEFDILRAWALPLFTFIAGLVLLFAVVLTDLFQPAQFNFPIIYALFLFVAAWTGSRLILLLSLVVTVTFTFVGYFFGSEPSQQGLAVFLLTNRFLAASALVIVCLALDCRLRAQKTHDDV